MYKISLHALGQETTSTRSALSRRVGAIPIRSRLEVALNGGEDVTLDFDGVEATQSFVDELVGVLIVQKGPSVLQHIKFRRCSETMKAIVQFVVSDRTDQFISQLGRNMVVETSH